MKISNQKTCPIILICIFFFSTVFSQIYRLDIRSYLPGREELGKWHQRDSAQVFAGEDLFTLIDGGADIYLEYGFKQVLAVEYQNDQESSVKLELYEMSNDTSAFGIFSVNAGTQGRKAQFGSGGIFNGYYLLFWKHSFFVSLTASDTTSSTITEMLAIASSVDKRMMGSNGTEPEFAKYLPKSGLKSYTYVKGMLGLNSQYIFDTKDIFEVKDGIIGNYETHNLFIFKYESEEKAEEIYKRSGEFFKNSDRFSKFKDSALKYTMRDQKEQILLVQRYKETIFIVTSKSKKILDDVCHYTLSLLKRAGEKQSK